MKEIKTFATLVDLDSLLDTRLSVINSFGLPILKEAFANKYSNRIIDQWSWLDNVEYAERYKNRDKRVLKDAGRTHVIELIKEFIKVTIGDDTSSPVTAVPKVIINTYPYQLSASEIVVLNDVFLTLLEDLDPEQLKFVNMSMEDITPSYVKNNISSLIMYEWWPWLNMHIANGNFKNSPCIETCLTGPEIFFNELPDRNSMQKAKELEMTHFEALTLCVITNIRLELMDSYFFSMDMGFETDVLSEIAKSRKY